MGSMDVMISSVSTHKKSPPLVPAKSGEFGHQPHVMHGPSGQFYLRPSTVKPATDLKEIWRIQSTAGCDPRSRSSSKPWRLFHKFSITCTNQGNTAFTNPHELASSMESYSTSQMLHREDRGHAFESTDRKVEEPL